MLDTNCHSFPHQSPTPTARAGVRLAGGSWGSGSSHTAGWESRGRRRGFGEVERRVSGPAGVTYRARYTMPDGTRYSRTLGTKMDAEAWLPRSAP